jgi:hypothetical protein
MPKSKPGPIQLSEVYEIPGERGKGDGQGRAFYQKDLGFGRVEVYPMPFNMGKVAIVNFEDLEATAANMDIDMPDDPLASIAASPNTPGIADVLDPDNAMRHIISAIFTDPGVKRHTWNVIQQRIREDGEEMEAHLSRTNAQRGTPVYGYPSLHAHSPHGVYAESQQPPAIT